MFLKHLRLFKPTIGNRIGLVMVGVLLCNVLTIGSGLHGLRQVEEQLGHLVNINTVKGDAVADMRFAVTARLDRVRNIALTSEVDDMQADQLAIDKLISEYARSTQTLESMSLQPREAELLASITTISAEAGRLMDQAQKLARMMNPEQAAALLTKKVAPLQLRWFAALDELDAISTGERTQTLNQASDVRRTAVLEMVFVGVLSLLMGAGSAFVLARSLRSRLRTSVAVTSRIAQGDLTVNVETQGRDEVAQLMTAVRDMQHRLLSTVVDIKRSTESIRLASSEIAVGNQDLSQRTEQQAARLQHTAASMQIMTDAVEASADGAQQAEALAATASEVAARGGSVVGRVVSTMGDIQASSKRIADIVGVIDGIAFQTNILALNAAVEAARAGEQGRGFAVVASEVRALAKRSADSAREIKTLIGASVENVELGAELVSDAGRTMTEIVDKVKRVGELIGQISSASSSQTSGIGEVNAAVVQLDQMTQSNAALVEQSAAASESLRAQAEQLAQAVAAFRVDDGVCT